MTAPHWTPRPIGDPERFAKASHQLHSLIQWLARMQRSFGPESTVEEPIRLYWRESRKAIETLPLGANLSLELRLPAMVLQFCEDGEAVNHPFEAEDHSPAHVEAWLLVEMLHRGIDRSRFSKALPYDVSNLMSGDSAEFAPEALMPELETLTAYLVEAAGLLTQAAGTRTPNSTIPLRPDDLSLESVRNGRDVIGFRVSAGTHTEPFFYLRSNGEGSAMHEATLPISRIEGTSSATNIMQFLANSGSHTAH